MSVFDPKSFLQQSVDGGNFETRTTPIPAGEYPASIESIDMEVYTKKGVSYAAKVRWSILDDNVKAALGLPKVTVRQTVFLDINESGQLEKGANKNIALGRIRAALGQENVTPWALALLIGAGPAKIKVTQRADDNDASIIYNDVGAVTKLTA